MRIAPVADVKARLSSYLEACVEGPVIVTKNGRPAAVLVAVGNEEELERLVLAHTPRFQAILRAAERRVQEGRGIKHADFWRLVARRRPERHRSPRAARLAAASRKT